MAKWFKLSISFINLVSCQRITNIFRTLYLAKLLQINFYLFIFIERICTLEIFLKIFPIICHKRSSVLRISFQKENSDLQTFCHLWENSIRHSQQSFQKVISCNCQSFWLFSKIHFAASVLSNPHHITEFFWETLL